MSDTKKLLKNSGIYGFVQILQKAIGFILLPVYMHYLSANDYGTVTVVQSIVSFLAVFYMLSLNGAITRYYYQYKDDEEKVKEFYGTNILFVMLNSAFLSTILIIFHKYLLQPFAKNIDFFPYLFLGLISITLNPIFNIFQSTLQAKQIGRKYGLNNFCYFIVNVSLILLFVVVFKLGAKGFLLAAAATDIIFFLYTLIDFIPTVILKINKSYLKESLSYSLPLLPHSLAGWTMSLIDRVLLNNMESTATAGVYNIGFQFGNILNVLTTAVNQAYVPWFFDKMNQGEDGKKNIITFCEHIVVFYAFVGMVISLFGYDVLKLLTSKAAYRSSWVVIPLIAFAYVFNGIYYFYTNPLFYNKKGTKFIPLGTFSCAILNLVLNICLIPKFGIVGSSTASLISNFLSSILILVISNKIEKVGFNYLKIYAIAFCFMGISMVAYLNLIFSFKIFLLVKILLLTVVLAFLYQKYKKEFKILCSYVRNRTK